MPLKIVDFISHQKLVEKNHFKTFVKTCPQNWPVLWNAVLCLVLCCVWLKTVLTAFYNMETGQHSKERLCICW